MSRKLLLDPYLAIHGKIMAKNGHFFMEFWPIFDIFHRLRPYLCSKRVVFGFHNQAKHRRRGGESFLLWGPPFMTPPLIAADIRMIICMRPAPHFDNHKRAWKMHFWDPSQWDKTCFECQRIKFQWKKIKIFTFAYGQGWGVCPPHHPLTVSLTVKYPLFLMPCLIYLTTQKTRWK